MTTKQTPLMEQYFSIKKQHPDKILFFRMGDFYEMFGRDAEVAAPILGIALTSRAHGKSTRLPLAGVPYHAAEKYLAQLLKAGLKVAICEQTEDPKKAKGLVRREVTEIITPGTITVEGALPADRENLIVSFHANGSGRAGFTALEFATGRVTTFEGPLESALDMIESLAPQEVLLSDAIDGTLSSRLERTGAELSRIEGWRFDSDYCENKIKAYYQVHSLAAFELEDRPAVSAALGSLLSYLEEMKFASPLHLSAPRFAEQAECVYLDAATLRNLEILRPSVGENKQHCLAGLLDFSQTAMGHRCLARWLASPLRQIDAIERRQQAVGRLVDDDELRDNLQGILKGISDLERLAGKLGYRKANPRDLVQLKLSLRLLPPLRESLATGGSELFTSAAEQLPDLTEVAGQIDAALIAEPPLLTNGGGLIRSGYSQKLDDLKSSIKGAVDFINGLQEKLRAETRIPSLKVGYNQVHGYYIEVTKPNLSNVPDSFIRKQTLVNAERFITEELKEKEELILAAEEKINAVEESIFNELRDAVAEHIRQINHAGQIVGEVDVLLSFAMAARRYGYVRPELTGVPIIEISEGRHPIIEQLLPRGDFVGNDTSLDTAGDQIQLLTGPNMAGKSTYLRQVGLIVIMAQAGSFVPADRARIGIVDRVFTRVGASDRLSLGESTFLVEMNETSRILNNATPQSLILLDEVGRGTSTYDGLAIAWALCELLHDDPQLRSRTIFATHFHELTELPNSHSRIKNYQVQVKRHRDKIIFLRKVKPGGCDDSFGIEVAKLAGIPASLTRRAGEILKQLEIGNFDPIKNRTRSHYVNPNQLALFEQKPSRVEQRLRELNIEELTPIDAINALSELRQLIREEGSDDQN